MKLFLASSLCEMKQEMLNFFGDMTNKKIAYITNPADADIAKAGDDLWWIKYDKDMLLSCAVELVPIDLRVTQGEKLQEVLNMVDGIYVSGGNTYYFRQLAGDSGYAQVINDLIINQKKWYMSTSAGSCVMGNAIKYLEGGWEGFTVFDGFDFVPTMILPHWGSSSFKVEYENVLPYLYKDMKSILALTDLQALIVDEGGMRVVSTKG